MRLFYVRMTDNLKGARRRDIQYMKEANFTEGKIASPLLKFTVPILLAILLQALYGAVDLLVVGQFGSGAAGGISATAQVSAVATGSQIMQTVTGIVTGLTMGTTVLIGQRIGQGKPEKAARAVGTSVLLFVALAAVLTVLMLLLARPFAHLMNAPEEAFSSTVRYVAVCSAGIVFIVAYNVISGILRGLGDSKMPLVFVAIACVVNIVGDLVLVGPCGLGATGAAIATAAAQAVSVVIGLIILRRRGLPFPFSVKNIRFNPSDTVTILRLGSPIALQDALTSVSFLIITAIINSLGLIESAAIGVGEKIVVFIMLIPIAFMSSVSAFVAQNIGAGKVQRARRAMLCAMGISLVFGVAMFVFSFFRGDILAAVFSNDGEVVAACAEYMKSYAIDCLLVCILFCFMGYFNGCGKTLFVMIQGIAAAFLVRIPFSYFMSRRTGVTMLRIGFASPLATLLSIILCIIYYFVTERHSVEAAE